MNVSYDCQFLVSLLRFINVIYFSIVYSVTNTGPYLGSLLNTTPSECSKLSVNGKSSISCCKIKYQSKMPLKF